uniref:EGF-like domain-containing protein n=1 Tax=Anolis carolinensis TaxID=28377 RepID=A0A803TR01_ANOCA|nr:PREDICTED: mucin-5AC [Anolis carolinensis]|eukprot:XP_008121575.1 PREDICTED: mucin-5AC [Anolis carolinensis]
MHPGGRSMGSILFFLLLLLLGAVSEVSGLQGSPSRTPNTMKMPRRSQAAQQDPLLSSGASARALFPSLRPQPTLPALSTGLHRESPTESVDWATRRPRIPGTVESKESLGVSGSNGHPRLPLPLVPTRFVTLLPMLALLPASVYPKDATEAAPTPSPTSQGDPSPGFAGLLPSAQMSLPPLLGSWTEAEKRTKDTKDERSSSTTAEGSEGAPTETPCNYGRFCNPTVQVGGTILAWTQQPAIEPALPRSTTSRQRANRIEVASTSAQSSQWMATGKVQVSEDSVGLETKPGLFLQSQPPKHWIYVHPASPKSGEEGFGPSMAKEEGDVPQDGLFGSSVGTTAFMQESRNGTETPAGVPTASPSAESSSSSSSSSSSPYWTRSSSNSPNPTLILGVGSSDDSRTPGLLPLPTNQDWLSLDAPNGSADPSQGSLGALPSSDVAEESPTSGEEMGTLQTPLESSAKGQPTQTPHSRSTHAELDPNPTEVADSPRVSIDPTERPYRLPSPSAEQEGTPSGSVTAGTPIGRTLGTNGWPIGTSHATEEAQDTELPPKMATSSNLRPKNATMVPEYRSATQETSLDRTHSWEVASGPMEEVTSLSGTPQGFWNTWPPMTAPDPGSVAREEPPVASTWLLASGSEEEEETTGKTPLREGGPRAPPVFVAENQPPLLKAALLRVSCELVLDMDFSRSLRNPESAEYQSLVLSINETVTPLLASLPGFQWLEVKTIRPGSVVVEFDALFLAKAPGLWAALDRSALSERLPAGLWVGNASLLRSRTQERHLDPCATLFSCHEGYECVAATEGALASAACVSVCHRDYCKNQGICTHAANQTPVCQCPVGSDFWFLGLRCDFRVTQQGVLGVACGLLLSLVVLGLAVAGLVIRRVRLLLLEARADQTKSSYRRFCRLDDVSAHYWSEPWLASASSLDNPAFSNSEELLHLQILDTGCYGTQEEPLAPGGYGNPIHGNLHLGSMGRPSSALRWEESSLGANDPMIDSGKASEVSVCSWPLEPIQWSPFPGLQRPNREPTPKSPRPLSCCEGMELVSLERSWTA